MTPADEPVAPEVAPEAAAPAAPEAAPDAPAAEVPVEVPPAVAVLADVTTSPQGIAPEATPVDVNEDALKGFSPSYREMIQKGHA
jgi:hypothetical protein